MPKRRTHDSFDTHDDPIGLTGAFAPIKGPQSVDYDTNDDPVGLTQAFGAIPDEEDERSWDEETKWKDFDWDAAFGEPVGDYGNADDEDAETGEDAADDATPSAQDAPATDEGEAAEAETETAEGGTSQPAAEGDSAPEPASTATTSAPAKSGPKHGRHAAAEPELSPRMKKSQRTRRVLIVLVILLALVIAAVVFFGYRTFTGSQQEAAQQTQEQTTANPKHDIEDAPADDALDSSTTKLADVPDLTSLLGKPQDQAINLLGRGAVVTANRAVNEEDNPIKADLNVALTEEPADSKTGTPTVYLGVGEDSAVLQVGYSASAAALGFGSLSFADAVNNEHVIEKTLAKVGVQVPEGSAVLPANKAEYSTYASDGTTVVRERCSFEGNCDANGTPCTWSAVLSYDYTTQVVTGNLNDTVRIIYVYITKK